MYSYRIIEFDSTKKVFNSLCFRGIWSAVCPENGKLVSAYRDVSRWPVDWSSERAGVVSFRRCRAPAVFDHFVAYFFRRTMSDIYSSQLAFNTHRAGPGVKENSQKLSFPRFPRFMRHILRLGLNLHSVINKYQKYFKQWQRLIFCHFLCDLF